MATRDDLYRLIDQLPDGELQPAERFLEYLRDTCQERRSSEASEGKDDETYSTLTEEDKAWLDADFGGPLPPYDWGPEGPPETKAVEYDPDKGWIVKGGKSFDR